MLVLLTVACCPLVSHDKYADGTDERTDGRTPDRYITLSDRRSQRNKSSEHVLVIADGPRDAMHHGQQ